MGLLKSQKKQHSDKLVIPNPTFEPAVTLVVAVYNEEDVIKNKIENCLALNYPQDKLNIVFVADGSSDNTRHN